MPLQDEIFDHVTAFCFSPAALKKSGIKTFIGDMSDDDRSVLWKDLQAVYAKGANGDVLASMRMLKHFHTDKTHYSMLQYVAFAHGLGGVPFDLVNILKVVVAFGKDAG